MIPCLYCGAGFDPASPAQATTAAGPWRMCDGCGEPHVGAGVDVRKPTETDVATLDKGTLLALAYTGVAIMERNRRECTVRHGGVA
jgi:hypothetical protein